MFVVSNGLCKSGSTLLCQYTIDLIQMVMPQNGQPALEEAIKEGRLSGVNHYVGPLDANAVKVLLDIAKKNSPFVVKCHTSDTELLRPFVEAGDIKVTFTHRDPRDIVLSAIDHGGRSRAENGGPFAEWETVSQHLPFLEEYVHSYQPWVTSGLSCVFRYTDLVSRPAEELSRLAEFLDLVAGTDTIQSVIEKEQAERRRGSNQFNTGKLTRYRDEMTRDEIELCSQKLGGSITGFGYDL